MGRETGWSCSEFCKLVNKQLDETPDNIDALLLKTQLLQRKEEYGLALSTINHAMKVNKPKKSGTSNALLHWWKAALYKDVNDIEKAIDEYSFAYKLAKKEDKENLQSISFDYASALFRAKKLDEADVIYKNMLAENLIMHQFDIRTVICVLRAAAPDYQEFHMNLCEQSLTNAIGLTLIGKDSRMLHIGIGEQEAIKNTLQNITRKKLRQILRISALAICDDMNITEEWIREYLS